MKLIEFLTFTANMDRNGDHNGDGGGGGGDDHEDGGTQLLLA